MIDQKTQLQAQMLTNRLSKKFKHLSKWAQRTGVGSFRLYDRDIPEIPLVLDFYSDIQKGDAVSGALYRRPYEKDQQEKELWLESMREATAAAIGLESKNIFLKQRERQRGSHQYKKLSNLAVTRIINEGSLFFKVNLSDYLDTGLFPERLYFPVRNQESVTGKTENITAFVLGENAVEIYR